MKPCPHPLDPIDVEALAAGVEPASFIGAADHARECAACGAAVAEASGLTRLLEEPAALAAPDLSGRVLRVRPFSRHERRSLSLWAGPSTFALLLFASGVLLLALPGITAREQASLAVAVAAPLFAVLRASVRAFRELALALPGGLTALSDVLHGNASLGLAFLLLLLPAGFGLRRAFARVRR